VKSALGIGAATALSDSARVAPLAHVLLSPAIAGPLGGAGGAGAGVGGAGPSGWQASHAMTSKNHASPQVWLWLPGHGAGLWLGALGHEGVAVLPHQISCPLLAVAPANLYPRLLQAAAATA
jgi:hypothetical protein